MKKQKNRIAILLALILILLSGCASETGQAEGESADSSGADGYEFIFVCPIMNNEYWKSCMEGIEKADKELGTATRVIGPAEAANFSTEIVGYMQEAVAAKPDGIMAYSGIESTWPYINQAGEEGIPFLAIDSDAPDTSRIAFVGTDSYNSGYMAGEAMVSLTGGNAKVCVLMTHSAPTNQINSFNAFKDAIADYDMEIVCVEEIDADPDASEAAVESLLSEHPEITAILGFASYHITGAARIKQAKGLSNLTLVGYDDVEENLAFVRDGIIDALIIQRPDLMGYQGVYCLYEYIERGTLSDDFYDTGTVLVTQDNADSYNN